MNNLEMLSDSKARLTFKDEFDLEISSEGIFFNLITPGVDYIKLCAPREKTPTHSNWQKKIHNSISTTIKMLKSLCQLQNLSIKLMSHSPNMCVICQSRSTKKTSQAQMLMNLIRGNILTVLYRKIKQSFSFPALSVFQIVRYRE